MRSNPPFASFYRRPRKAHGAPRGEYILTDKIRIEGCGFCLEYEGILNDLKGVI
jgi:hypothetical protein